MGEERAKKDDFIYTVTGELGWFTTKEVRKLLEISQKKGFVSVKDEVVEPLLDYKKEDIPLGFKPSKRILEIKAKEDTFQKLLKSIVGSTDIDRKEIIAEVNKVQSEMNVDIKTALFLAADRKGIDVPDKRDMVEKVRAEILGENSG